MARLRRRSSSRWSCSPRCWSASSRRRSARCSRRSASPGWTGSCSATCSPRPAAPSRPRATSTPCCWTRPARSPSATGRPPRCIPAPGVGVAELAAAARLSSLADQTPEGRSIVELCAAEHGLPAEATADGGRRRVRPVHRADPDVRARHRRARGPQGRRLRGRRAGWGTAALPTEVTATVDRIADEGGTPLVVAERGRAAARGCSASSSCPTWSSPACAERFAELRAMGIRTVMITGDNPLTAQGDRRARRASTTSSPRPPPRTRWR